MSRNRLNLNFQLESAIDRRNFVDSYLASIDFIPNESELETISNYILWGKNSKGLNTQQEGLITLKEWAQSPIESIDELMEMPGFQESSLRSIQEPPVRIPRTTFSRTKALQTAPSHLVPIYNSLFNTIDQLELIINFYELFCGKRKLPPRDELLNRFTLEEQTHLNEKALRLSQYKYLKLKHLLKELRTEQYTYSDSHITQIMPHTGSQLPNLQEERIYIGEDITAYPAGLKTQTPLSSKIFNEFKFPEPNDFTDEELKVVSDLLWAPQTKLFIDFTNEEHILELYNARFDLEDMAIEDPSGIYNAAQAILLTLQYYQDRAQLSDLQLEILNLKLHKVPNFDIARQVNATYNKSYNENYISTIYHQKIIPSIAAAASQHLQILSNLFYPENFKKCKDCGRVLLLNTDNFVKQKKSSDGFSPRCKACEKIKRSKYK